MSSSIPLSFDLERRQLSYNMKKVAVRKLAFYCMLLQQQLPQLQISFTELFESAIWMMAEYTGNQWRVISFPNWSYHLIVRENTTQRKAHTHRHKHTHTNAHMHPSAHMHPHTCTHITTSFILINTFLSNNYKAQLSQISLLLKI